MVVPRDTDDCTLTESRSKYSYGFAFLLFTFEPADPYFVELFGVLTIGMFVGVISGAVLSVLPQRWHALTMRRTPSRGG
jgi:hypothetical protein